MGVWPGRQDLDVEGWLSNFDSVDGPLAEALLDKFVYYDDHLSREVLRRAVRQAIATVQPEPSLREADLASAIFTCPPGEDGSPTASGYAYLRMLRELGVGGNQALHPEPALLAKEDDPTRPLIIIDDFSCTGAQFDHYWATPIDDGAGGHVVPSLLNGAVVFAPLFAAWLARSRVTQYTNVAFQPVHVVGGVLNAPTVAPHRRRIREISLQLGAVDSAGASTVDWKGFGGLAHAIAVGGTIPDSCLPIFYLEAQGWTPLKRRRA